MCVLCCVVTVCVFVVFCVVCSGSRELAAIIADRQPPCHLHGHIHEQYGVHRDDVTGVVTVNSALCDYHKTSIVNGPHVLTVARSMSTGQLLVDVSH